MLRTLSLNEDVRGRTSTWRRLSWVNPRLRRAWRYLLIGCLLPSTEAAADPVLRTQLTVEGDFMLIGNTLAHDCRVGVAAPVVGTVGPCGVLVDDGAPDVLWRSESSTAAANLTVLPGMARSRAYLAVPPGATIEYARLYWAGSGVADDMIDLSRSNAFSESLSATQMWSADGKYQCTREVTALVALHGTGVYELSNVATSPLSNLLDETAFAAWAIVVVYSLPSAPSRVVTILDGFEVPPSDATHGGFESVTMPSARIGVLAYEGDAGLSGEQVRLGAAPLDSLDVLVDNQNPANDCFNSTRSLLGTPQTIAGDLPQLTGGPASMSGLDLDVMDASSHLQPGQTQVAIDVTSAADQVFIGMLVTSIETVAHECASDTDCPPNEPVCDLLANPRECVAPDVTGGGGSGGSASGGGGSSGGSGGSGGGSASGGSGSGGTASGGSGGGKAAGGGGTASGGGGGGSPFASGTPRYGGGGLCSSVRLSESQFKFSWTFLVVGLLGLIRRAWRR